MEFPTLNALVFVDNLIEYVLIQKGFVNSLEVKSHWANQSSDCPLRMFSKKVFTEAIGQVAVHQNLVRLAEQKQIENPKSNFLLHFKKHPFRANRYLWYTFTFFLEQFEQNDPFGIVTLCALVGQLSLFCIRHKDNDMLHLLFYTFTTFLLNQKL
ncbi:hypothetical protein CEXT_263371 [Caerostris extrusa]|uniref:Uncharacterized protein n=1 Tax=Caerostris extrusa TaxID=172846 RepID=A0AAV4VJJ5_CAEEX|nr:hypothetical protein CEXT_263371 [Caerostris extrusa]